MPSRFVTAYHRVPRFVVCLVVALGATGCPFDNRACGCSPPPIATGLVVGTVTTAAGAPAALAHVNVAVVAHDCLNTQPAANPQPTSTWVADAAGRYVVPVSVGNGVANDTVCVRVVAHPAGARATIDSSVVPNKLLHVSMTVQDSVHVDLQLP
jgi:hypothetical protein